MSKTQTEHCCATCEFNGAVVCMGYGKRIDNGELTYGMSIEEAEKMFPQGCSDWGISLGAFMDEEGM